MMERIVEFASDFNSELVFDCDVGDDAQIERLFRDLSAHWPKFSSTLTRRRAKPCC
jgi:enoyl-[acyl-carrier protein] reductase I